MTSNDPINSILVTYKKKRHAATCDFPRTRCDNPTNYLSELPVRQP